MLQEGAPRTETANSKFCIDKENPQRKAHICPCMVTYVTDDRKRKYFTLPYFRLNLARVRFHFKCIYVHKPKRNAWWIISYAHRHISSFDRSPWLGQIYLADLFLQACRDFTTMTSRTVLFSKVSSTRN